MKPIYTAVVRLEEAAVARWEKQALLDWETRARRLASTQTLMVGGSGGELRALLPAVTSDRDLGRLADAEAKLDTARRNAGERVIRPANFWRKPAHAYRGSLRAG